MVTAMGSARRKTTGTILSTTLGLSARSRRPRPPLALWVAVVVGLTPLAVSAQTAPPPAPPPSVTPPAEPPAAIAPEPAPEQLPTPAAPAAPNPAPPVAPALPRPPAAPTPPYPYATPPPGYSYPSYPQYPYGYAPPSYPQYPQYSYPQYAPPPPPPRDDAAASVTISVPPPGSARRPAEDPQADRGVLLPTAYTHPKGTWFFSDYDLVLVQLGYAFTDDTQISLTAIPPLGGDDVSFVDLTLKTTLYRGGLVRLAALGSTSGLVSNETGVLGVGRVGGVAQLCLERRCDSSFSLSTNMTLAGAILMTNGVNGIFRLGHVVSLLAELDTLIPLTKDAGEFGGALFGGGVRFHWTRWGLDLALMHVLGNDKETLPLIAFTHRS
jgi:hypothetical protein